MCYIYKSKFVDFNREGNEVKMMLTLIVKAMK